MIVFADTSALGSLYLGDEADAAWIKEVILDGPDPVVVCDLAEVELSSLLARARDDGRIDEPGVAERLGMYREQTADDGPIGVVPLTRDTLSRAGQLVLRATVRTLDALHLAAAQLLADASNDVVAILTRDVRQARAAEALGFQLYPAPAE